MSDQNPPAWALEALREIQTDSVLGATDDDLARIIAASAPKDEWLPIEALVPEFGMRIIGSHPIGGWVECIEWDGEHWTIEGDYAVQYHPTHWRPLPPAPAAMKGDA